MSNTFGHTEPTILLPCGCRVSTVSSAIHSPCQSAEASFHEAQQLAKIAFNDPVARQGLEQHDDWLRTHVADQKGKYTRSRNTVLRG